MIALTDAALGQIVVAASRVPHEQRAEWLNQVATRLERGKRNALNSARYRHRRRRGQVVLEVTANVERLTDFLVRQQYLVDDMQHDRRMLQGALAALVDDLAKEIKNHR